MQQSDLVEALAEGLWAQSRKQMGLRADYMPASRTDFKAKATDEIERLRHTNDAPVTTAPPAPVNRLRRILKGWADWYRLATADDDNEYLNGKGWDDAEALEDMTLAALWDQSTSQENLK